VRCKACISEHIVAYLCVDHTSIADVYCHQAQRLVPVL
jgi:hypothetical protein